MTIRLPMKTSSIRALNKRREAMTKSIRHIVVSFGVLLIVWQLAGVIFQWNTALFPTPVKTFTAWGELVTVGLKGSSSGTVLTGHILVSLGRFIAGYLLSAAIGIILGLILGWHPGIFAYVNPIIQLVRPIAPVAWMPFIVLFAGVGNAPAIVIIFLAGFFPVLLSTVSAVSGVEPVYLKLAANLGMSGKKTLMTIVFPAAFPQIANSLHLALGTAWIFLVSGEMVGAQSGLGFLVMDAKNCIRTDALLAVILTIGIIGLLLDLGIRILEKQTAKWFGLGSPQMLQDNEGGKEE